MLRDAHKNTIRYYLKQNPSSCLKYLGLALITTFCYRTTYLPDYIKQHT